MTAASAPSTPFPAAAGEFVLHGPAGAIQAMAGLPDAADARDGVAIICHPHPLHGGTMHNKVVTMLERALRELGLATLRFNFRGVGASAGTHDDGLGETLDLIAISEWVRAVRPGAALWLTGFSFGSFVAAKAARHLSPAQLVLIAPPVGKWPFAALPLPTCPWLVVQGEADDVVSPQAVFDWIAELADPPTLVRMPDTDHFFHRRLLDLRGAVKNAVKANLPPTLAG
jgi:alpha/beta superfamily hydrolase